MVSAGTPRAPTDGLRQPHPPSRQRGRQRAVIAHLTVEFGEVKHGPSGPLRVGAQPQYLPPSDRGAEADRRTCAELSYFSLSTVGADTELVAQTLHRGRPLETAGV